MTRRALLLAAGIALALHYVAMRLVDGWRPAPRVDGCIWEPCVATWKHWHGGFPGGYDDPADPEGTPIEFEGGDPDPTAVRDYNGAAIG